MRYYCHSCIIICMLASTALKSQFYFSSSNNPEPEPLWEIGVSAGAINCLTDIGGKSGPGTKFIKDINWNQTQFCAGFFASATWHSVFGLRLEATTGQVTGDDDVLKTSTDIARNRYLRHLHFKTAITELSLMGDLYPLSFINKEEAPGLLSPYVIAGVGIFNYNPKAMINNVWTDLRPLHTEGQEFKEYPDRKEYKSFNWCLPVGAGVKYDVAGSFILRLEILYRFTGTDYLDDVSTSYVDPALFNKYLSPAAAALASKLSDRSGELPGGVPSKINAIRGNPSNRDAYFSCMFKISMALGRSQRK